MIFAMLKTHEINSYWDRCREILKLAFRNRLHIHSVDDYYVPLNAGEFQLWIALKDDALIGAVVTNIDTGSQARVCNVLSLAGENLEEWIGLVEKHITDFAMDNACDAIEWVGRRGFARLVTGFVEDGIVYIKELNHG